ncbi:hypothetical protein SESBI_10426 [Sesbania bispinosa]|nr:hypothetical protein SESBI_10426 [Sesbania bispinosa]
MGDLSRSAGRWCRGWRWAGQRDVDGGIRPNLIVAQLLGIMGNECVGTEDLWVGRVLSRVF